MSTITIGGLLKECDLDENHLNVEIEREHFPEISSSLTDWRVLALKLAELFSEGVVADIEANKHHEEDKRLEFLKQLKQKLSFNATYGLLVRNLLKIERADDARSLCCHLKNLTGSKREKLIKQDENLEKKFENVIETVQASFTENEVMVDKVVSSLKFIKCHEEKQIVRHHFRELLQDRSLDNLFFTFSDIWDYIHPGLLEFIVERFGTTSDKNIVQEYKEDLEKYRGSTKLGEFVKIICNKPNPPLLDKELSVQVGEDWRHKTLQDLEDVRLQAADKAKCDRLLFRVLPRQSIFTIVFSMPSWVQLNLVEMYPVLSTIGATKVYLNNDYIYECVPLKKEADENIIEKEFVICSKIKKLHSFQIDVSEEMISHFPYILDSDFENLITKISACLNENDVKEILALRQGHKIHDDPRNIFLDMFHEREIMKFSPGSFQTVLKKIERKDLIPIVYDFYNNCTKPKIITEKTIDHEFESLHDFMISITSSLWDLEPYHKIASLVSLSSKLENIFYHGYKMYESIQNAILEFSEKQSIEEEVIKDQKLEAEMAEKTRSHRLKVMRTRASTIRGLLREQEKRNTDILKNSDSTREYSRGSIYSSGYSSGSGYSNVSQYSRGSDYARDSSKSARIPLSDSTLSFHKAQKEKLNIKYMPKGMREVFIERPNEQHSFGFVLQSSTVRPGCIICSLVPDSPADRSGQLYVYDELLAVNGKDVSEMDHADIVSLVIASSTHIFLTVQQPLNLDELQQGDFQDESSATNQSVVPLPTGFGDYQDFSKQGGAAQGGGGGGMADDELPQISANIAWCKEEFHTIDFKRSGGGFGFTIKGGEELKFLPYVSHIVMNGAAAKDGRLRVGDDLLEINGNSTKGMLHSDAVTITKHGSDRLALTIFRKRLLGGPLKEMATTAKDEHKESTI